MGCADDLTLARFERGELSAEERGELLDHAAECVECRAAVSVLVATASPGAGAPGPDPERQRIGRYTLGAILGRGAMGVVYAARDPELEREVAVKLLRPQASALRLRREAQALAKLAHPNVVRVYDVGEDAGQTFIAMELVDGENLRQWLVTPRTSAEILDVLVRAGRGLVAAHAAGLVHRDFKPDNVMIARTGEVMVGDFGLARSAHADEAETGGGTASGEEPSSDALTATGTVIGTPAYMAPEQMAGEATAASDQFAFCATAWEALFGRRPFEGATLAELMEAARTKQPVRPPEVSVPRRVEVALRRGLSPDPAARFASMGAVLAALAPPSRARRRWILGGVLVAAGAVATVGATRATRAPAVDCAATASLLDPVWSATTANALATKFDRLVADAFDHYATAWRAARVEACQATHERHEQTEESLERRVACLDRARAQFALTLDEVMRSSSDSLLRVTDVVPSLPSLARCTAAPVVPMATTFAATAAIAELDVEVTRLAVSVSVGTPDNTLAEATALRKRAEATGHEPLVLRALVLEARVAAWTGALATAEAGLREVMLRAEQSGDDFTRAHAGALLARVISVRPDEATALIATARAALQRAGRDPAIEQLLLEAEVSIAAVRGDYRSAGETAEKIAAMIEARGEGPSKQLATAYTSAASMWALAGDTRRFSEANTRASATTEALRVRLGAALDGAPSFDKDVMSFAVRGDFTGAVARARELISQLQAAPDRPYLLIAQITGMLAFSQVMDQDYPACLASYRAAEAAWSLPVERYAYGSSPPDVVSIASGQIDSVFGIASCLEGLRRYEDEIVALRRARELASAGGPATASWLAGILRALGRAYVDAGHPREGRELLEPIVADVAALPPTARANVRFALARALWLDGGLADRPRALALVADAAAELEVVVKTKPEPMMRKMPALAAEILGDVRAWQAAHAAPASPP